MLTTMPLEAFVCREVMTNLFFATKPFNLIRHCLLTTGLVLAAVALATLTCDLGVVFELIGATSACALAYIFPPLCFIKLSTRSWKTSAAVACVIFGSGVLLISTVLSIVKIMNRKTPHPSLAHQQGTDSGVQMTVPSAVADSTNA